MSKTLVLEHDVSYHGNKVHIKYGCPIILNNIEYVSYHGLQSHTVPPLAGHFRCLIHENLEFLLQCKPRSRFFFLKLCQFFWGEQMDPEHIILQEYQDRYWVAFGHPWDLAWWKITEPRPMEKTLTWSMSKCLRASLECQLANRANGRQVIASLAEKMTINL